MDDLVVPVDDLFGHPGKLRSFAGDRRVELRLGETRVKGPMVVEGEIEGLLDAVKARFTARAEASFVCIRCTKEWLGPVEARAEQYFGFIPDEDGYCIEDDSVDVGPPAQDELALALPAAPLCSSECKGLCPTCGTDLNVEPCDGHGDEPDSPFSVLKDLFDS